MARLLPTMARRGSALSQAEKLFEAMARNPKGDWRTADIEVVCRHFKLTCKPPSGGGSHYGVSHPSAAGGVTIPARRPIKPFYIRAFVDDVERSIHGVRHEHARLGAKAHDILPWSSFMVANDWHTSGNVCVFLAVSNVTH